VPKRGASGSISSGSRCIGNRSWANRAQGVFIDTNVDNVVVWHNVMHGNVGAGLFISALIIGCDVRNNIFSDNATHGVDGAPTFAAFDFNNAFGNVAAPCNGCTPGASSLTVDPQFREASFGDFRLLPSSELINAATPTTWDLNGPAPGTFNRTAPDIGAHETP